MDARTEEARRLWDRRAAACDRWGRAERVALRSSRELLCSGARGRTLEVAVGTGRNLEYYPPGVELTGIDVSAAMLARARRRAEEVGRRVALVEADAQDLPFEEESFDTVLCTLSMCAIPDQGRALAEMYRVLVPGGRLLMVDHIEYARAPLRWIERRRAHPRGLPRDLALAAGFAVGHHDRLFLGLVERLVAHRPA
ncbi:phosphatidylethanolamine N-methyltransferase /phosphatidyl-N-methylethanolamine N-methyltransferase [Nocardiopsis sp. Huas11]|uniref:class I SAM-dependent methyltransferase n=1 Tax=Nocardiopsis sp. Huas11 TaxID=2183912 RepID=UPI000EB3717F|nr:class I SAM-dependent methyltransferase [Nocardiopsis sp. Huas11]RKS05289.1 phosphatidylethanolamine N-methyltransferase /phosphatidyl-N-methylethanolamine N-methyltransferase [Nocardiopsis sp. Huas11]